MPRFFALLAAAFFALALNAAHAEDYRDPQGLYSVTVPDGWTKQIQPMQGISLALLSPRILQTGGNCPITVTPSPELQSMTQEQINEGLLAAIDDTFWRQSFSGPGFMDVRIDSSGNELRDGRRVFFANATFTAKEGDTIVEGKFKVALHVVPGRMLAALCAALTPGYPVEATDFEIVFGSFAPGTNVIARAPEASGSAAKLVLYSGPRFDGFSREIAHDVPNLPAVGWSGATASFKVAGFGQWELCDGLNFTGRCRVAPTASAAAFGDRAARIGSVRRLSVREPRNALGIAAAVLPAQLSTAVAKGTRK